MKRTALGGGGRFEALEHKLAQRPGVTNPAALAAAIGRKKLGKARFQALAAAGRKRHAARHPATQKDLARNLASGRSGKSYR